MDDKIIRTDDQQLDSSVSMAMGRVAELFMAQDKEGKLYMPVAEMRRIGRELANNIRLMNTERYIEELDRSDSQFKTKTKAWKEYHAKRREQLDGERLAIRTTLRGKPYDWKVEADANADPGTPLIEDPDQPVEPAIPALPVDGSDPSDQSPVRQTLYRLEHHDSPQVERQKDNQKNA